MTASKREQVIEAVFALVEAALPLAKARRNEVKSETIPDGGYVIVGDGDPGEPEVTLSPTTYLYEHRVEITVAAKKLGLTTAASRLDDMLAAIGAAFEADRTLGGLCDYVSAEAPSTDSITAQGAVPARVAEFGIIAVYGTSNPLI